MAKINNETHVEFIETTSTKLENVQATHPGAFIHVNDLNGDDVLPSEIKEAANMVMGRITELWEAEKNAG